jgi:hypothetical protein
MTFEPDIVVTIPGEPGIFLVVEAKTTLTNLVHAEEALKRYMVSMQCQTGLLITPERMWLYRDSYTSRTPQSVRRVSEVNLKPLWEQQPPPQPARFEAFVQHWLEDLSKRSPDELPNELRDPVREYILPALAGGEVRAAHPRPS